MTLLNIKSVMATACMCFLLLVKWTCFKIRMPLELSIKWSVQQCTDNVQGWNGRTKHSAPPCHSGCGCGCACGCGARSCCIVVGKLFYLDLPITHSWCSDMASDSYFVSGIVEGAGNQASDALCQMSTH